MVFQNNLVVYVVMKHKHYKASGDRCFFLERCTRNGVSFNIKYGIDLPKGASPKKDKTIEQKKVKRNNEERYERV